MWQSFIQWFSDLINLIYTFTAKIGLPSYGLAIVFMTIAIKLVLFPLTQKQMKSMRAMQDIAPKTKWLQEKYKDDPQLMQTKVMELYKEHGVNPMGGCLPLLVQMPIFIAFYQSLFKFEYLDAAHKGFLRISDIALAVKMDPEPTKFLLPILAALSTYLQQVISMGDPKKIDPTQAATQKTMLYFMPLMMGYIVYTVPAGLGIYWVTFNLLGILQQLYVNHSHKNQQLVDTGVGIQVDLSTDSDSTEEAVAPNDTLNDTVRDNSSKTSSDKGGSEKDAQPKRRKKRKKR